MHDEQITALKTASSLLQIKAIKLNVKNPFIWVSGIRSPIYCDNRQILSYPGLRAAIAADLAAIVSREFPSCEVIAGVATGAIAHGVLVADKLNKPFIYVRSSPKGHGLANQIEGHLPQAAKVVVIEDLISTGQSSLEAVEALRAAGAGVLGMAAIFTYELPRAILAMEERACPIFTLSNFSSLLIEAQNRGLLSEEEAQLLAKWRMDPESFYNGSF